MAQQHLEPAQLGPRPTLDWDCCLADPSAGRQFLEEYGKAFRNQTAGAKTR